VPGYEYGDLHDGYLYHIKKVTDFNSNEAFLEAIKAIYE
jgi:hypothetical protein